MTIVAGHTLGTPDLDLPAAFELFQQAGLDGAEVVWQKGYPAGISGDVTAARLTAIASVAAGLGVPIVCLTPYFANLNNLDPQRRVRDITDFKRCIDAAAVCGASLVRAYAGSVGEREGETAVQWSHLVEALREVGEYAQSVGVVVCIENHFNTMAVSAAATASLVRDVACDGVGILYDQANLSFCSAEPYGEAIALQEPWIRHCHLKDFVFREAGARALRAPRAQSVSHVDEDGRNVWSRPLGDGVLPWRKILARLFETGYAGPLTLEYEYRWHPHDLPPPQEGFARGARHVRAILEELRRDRDAVETGAGT